MNYPIVGDTTYGQSEQLASTNCNTTRNRNH